MSEVRQEWLDHFLSLEFDEGRARELILYLIKELNPYVPDEEVKIEFVDGLVEAQKLLNMDSAIAATTINFRKFYFRLPIFAQAQLKNYLVEVVFTDHKKTILQQVHHFIDTFFSQRPDILHGVDVNDVPFVRGETIRKLLFGVVSEVSKQVQGLVERMRHDRPFFPFWNPIVFSAVRNRILAAARNDMYNIFGSIGTELLRYVHLVSHGDISDFEWVSLYDALQRAGLIEVEGLSHYIRLVKANVFFWVPSFKGSIVCRPPESIKFDDRNRLHCVDGYAVRFRDGYGQFWVHGVNFDVKTFDRFFTGKHFTPRNILGLRNVEQRIALMQYFGLEFIFDHIDSKRRIDRDKCFSAVTRKRVTCELYDCDLEDMEPVRLLRLEDHSTHKPVILSVPVAPETQSCRGAIAWTFGMREKEYTPLMET